MNRKDLLECLLYAGLRLLGICLLLGGGLGLLVQLAESWYRFDPNYLGAFLLASFLRPGLLLLAGLLLSVGAAPLARRLARPFADSRP